MILAGDVGGTKCNLALFEGTLHDLRPILQRRLESRSYRRFEDVVADFLAGAGRQIASGERIPAAGFGVAGPVVGRRVRVTNLPWEIDADSLAREFGFGKVALLNDLEAAAYGALILPPRDLRTLNEGAPVAHANRAVIAAGTGLGQAILFWEGSRFLVSPTEGGHADFAPRTDREIDLLRYLKRRQRWVELEYILSGAGFRTIHEFLAPDIRHPSFDQPDADPAPEITRLALDRVCPHCVEALDLFVTIYGAEAGNLALRTLALGGVYVAGGIALKILPKLEDGTFVRSFREKARFPEMLARIPIHVVLREDVALLGAASRAATLRHG
jgi:glucokinase